MMLVPGFDLPILGGYLVDSITEVREALGLLPSSLQSPTRLSTFALYFE
jgi:hypothetical protein